ncbi:MAG: single-stranded DNA-binding protein [Bacteroidetes bacterium]|nr:single-stranded DNA-binding protein [Bacteroidota bacterium]
MQQVTGRLTADAVVRTLDSGKEVVSFSIADNDTFKRKGAEESETITTYFNCAFWLGTGVAKVLLKGAVVQLNGRLTAKPYQTNTGDMAASLNFNASRISVLAYAPKDKRQTDTAKPAKENRKGPNETKDDLPF